MEKETAFWEAIVSLAPLLGLTIVLELRHTRWDIYPGGRVIAASAMSLALFGLATATTLSLSVLHDWGKIPVKPDIALTVQGIVSYAIFVVLVTPISQTLYIFFGKDAGTMHRLYMESRRERKAFQLRIRELKAVHHELQLDVLEHIIGKPNAVFGPPGAGVLVTDPQVVRLRRLTLTARIESIQAQIDFLKWEKKNRKMLKRAEKRFGVDRRMKYIRRYQASA